MLNFALALSVLARSIVGAVLSLECVLSFSRVTLVRDMSVEDVEDRPRCNAEL